MEQLDVLVAERVRRVLSQSGRDSDDLARCLDLPEGELPLLLAAERSFTLAQLVCVADLVDCPVEALIPDVDAPSDGAREVRTHRLAACETHHSQTLCDANHSASPAVSQSSGNLAANAQGLLEYAAEGMPRLTGFREWRPAVPGLPYLSGAEPHAVAVIVIHDPRDGRVCSATLVASPDGAAAAR
ncbi:hypothetical protein FOH10_34245 [Nocardia otitidiscaviarum]|uniref:Uncharacterized protein n=1 Tax=Nocardia otitidiscaviarum TaxID=1823 RepID=A0A516NVU1_9NOCA|nr:hypothetical protein [Nocardia otitidiscaviarum]MCP9622527.1 hypothetical protein [Nocardia otitidiscaviarum]QDP83029.1 hypothetical protein FOH10_34245 [Nocardia otitidiscaviarum]